MCSNDLGRAARAFGASCACLAVLLAGGDASAQYFGSNRVQYDRLDFKVLSTQHFDIYYHQSEDESVTLAARMAERWYARLSSFFGHELSTRQALVLYASHPSSGRRTSAAPSPAKNLIDQDPILKGRDIDVTVNNGVVTLKGEIESDADRKRLVDAATRVRGVQNVVDSLQLAAGK